MFSPQEKMRGSIKELDGVVVLSTNAFGSGILSATFFYPDLENMNYILKIVPETSNILN